MISQRVLLFHSWGIGDLVMATPMIQSLKESGHKVDLCLTSSAPKALIKEHEIVEKIFVHATRLALLRFIVQHRNGYDAFVVTSGTNMRKARLLALLLNARLYAKSINTKLHRIDDNIENVSALISTKVQRPLIALASEQKFHDSYLHPAKPNIALAVGSGKNQTFKRWPFERFLELSHKLEAAGAQVLFLIGPDEPELLKKAQERQCRVVKAPLEQIALLISKLDLLVGNDNGLMHLGYATNIETVTIFGMTDERIIGGYDAKRNHSVALELECRPCFSSEVGKIACQNTICLSRIEVEHLFDKSTELLKGRL